MSLLPAHSFLSSLASSAGQTTMTPNYQCTDDGQTAQFTFSTSSHSASSPLSNCSLSQCANGPIVNTGCRSSSTPCFEYRSTNNTIVCAPAVQCSILEPCDNLTFACSSNTSMCVINSCCSTQAICLPVKATYFCRSGIRLRCRTGWSLISLSRVVIHWKHECWTILAHSIRSIRRESVGYWWFKYQ